MERGCRHGSIYGSRHWFQTSCNCGIVRFWVPRTELEKPLRADTSWPASTIDTKELEPEHSDLVTKGWGCVAHSTNNWDAFLTGRPKEVVVR
jgi:hypothetical protein